MSKDNLEKGDIVIMEYGYDFKEFFIADKVEDKYLMGRASWCNSSAKWMTLTELEKYKVSFIRKGTFNIFSKMPLFGNMFTKYLNIKKND